MTDRPYTAEVFLDGHDLDMLVVGLVRLHGNSEYDNEDIEDLKEDLEQIKRALSR